MALFVRGRTPCGICGQVLEQDDEVAVFPPFVANRKDPLWRFSENAFHHACLKRDPLGKLADRRYRETLQRLGPGMRSCAACGREILDPDEYLTFGHLTDADHPLRQFNYLQLHRSCVPLWPAAGRVLALIEQFYASGTWEGEGLGRIIDDFRALAWQ